MKPPPRKRTRRTLDVTPAPQRLGRTVCKWPLSEQKKLLAALTKLCPGDLSARDSLDLERVREHLPTRSASEINSVLEALKEKIILFAKTKLRTETREERAQKPLDMWLDEACAVTGDVDSLSTAFTQVLAVASIEPRTLKIHAPPQQRSPVPLPSKSPVAASSASGMTSSTQTPSFTEDSKKTSKHPHTPATGQSPTVQGPVGPGPLPQLSKPSSLLSPMTEVSFERIYYYLSALHKPSNQCKLTSMESAIVLDLLLSLPEELQLLDCDKLGNHLSQVYLSLSSDVDSGKTSSEAVKRPQPSVIQDQKQPQSAPKDSCTQGSPHMKLYPPLNPFLIPLSLLSRKVQKK